MAEAAAAPRHRFFCHCCKGEVDPKLPEYVCPRCESGFIEEVAEGASLLQSGDVSSDGVVDSDGMASHFAELWQLLFMERSAILSDPAVPGPDPPRGTSAPPSLASGYPPVAVRHVAPLEESLGALAPAWRPSGPDHGPEVEGMVQQFLAGLFTTSGNRNSPPSSWSVLHSDLGDYAWDQGGVDAVISQLLGQLENTGPPPAEKAMISSLPVIHVSSEQAAGRLECPVCREDYSVGELVRQLPCLHCYHTDCIVPWLQLHDTCPVCRKSLNGEDHSLPPLSVPQEPSEVTTETFRMQDL